MTARQAQILDFVRQNREITLDDAAATFGAHYYANAKVHLGRRFARMIRRGLLLRAGRGRYVAASPPPFLQSSQAAPLPEPFALEFDAR